MSNTDASFLVLTLLGMINFVVVDSVASIVSKTWGYVMNQIPYDHTKHELVLWALIILLTVLEVHYLSLGS